MRSVIASLVSGLLFGAGLTVSQMVNPAKVVAFLDVTGDFDPSLALVMVAALGVTSIGYRLVLRKSAPLCAAEFHLPVARRVDRRLIAGSALFGVGWGIAGFCPGPAIASLAFGLWQPVVFTAAMIAGMLVWERRDALFSLREHPVRVAVPHRPAASTAR